MVFNMIPICEPSLGKEELDNVIDAVNSSWISSNGPFVSEFEENFADYCGTKYGIATSNGTVALHLALKALGIKNGDEVIVPALTFIATANSVSYCGAKSVFVDSDPTYWCMDPEKIERQITSKSKAIIPVHLYGHPCDMKSIMEISEDHGLYVIEDVAEAHGAEFNNKKVGSFGDISCFSFYGNKIMTTGEGGMCITNDENINEKMRVLRDHGMDPNKKYWHEIIGFNYRMTNLQAAVGVAQLKKLDGFVDKKRQLAKWYEHEFKDLSDEGFIKMHPEMSWAKCVYWMYSLLINDKCKIKKEKLMEKLNEKGIDTRPFFHSVHTMPPYANNQQFPISEQLSTKGINLPSSTTLSKEDVSYIANSIREVINGNICLSIMP